MNTKLKNIDRREALKRTALIMGSAVSVPVMTGLLQGCVASNEPTWTPVYMDEQQASVVTSLTDTILPTTDTPGAVDVGVPQFIDRMLMDVYEQEWQTKFNEGLVEFNTRVEETYGKSFEKLDQEQKNEIVLMFHEEALNKDGGYESNFVMSIKELTVAAYCTSEAGATMVLKYDKIPGEYKGCIDFSEVGKTWAT